MKEFKSDLKAVTKLLTQLTQKTEQMMKRLEKLDKAQTVKAKPVRKAVIKKLSKKEAAQPTGIDLIFGIIKKSKKGVGTETLKKKTGFDQKKVWNTINLLKRKGMVKSGGRGTYVKA